MSYRLSKNILTEVKYFSSYSYLKVGSYLGHPIVFTFYIALHHWYYCRVKIYRSGRAYPFIKMDTHNIAAGAEVDIREITK